MDKTSSILVNSELFNATEEVIKFVWPYSFLNTVGRSYSNYFFLL